jgi:hypothetical protein
MILRSASGRSNCVPGDSSLGEHIENRIASPYILRRGLTARPEMHRPLTKKPRDSIAMQSKVQVIVASPALFALLC